MFGYSFEGMFSIILGVSKDHAYIEAVKNMQKAFQDLVLAEADSRRSKTDTLIRIMAKYDREVYRFKREYFRIREQLTTDAQKKIDKYILDIEKERKLIVREKNALATRR